MIDILKRYTKSVLFHSETAESISLAIIEAINDGADLSDANLRYADLSGADLRGADLSGANLRGADLRYANLRDAKQRIVAIKGSTHSIVAIDSDVHIGCCRHDIDHWIAYFEEIGKEHGYTPAQIKEYGMHLRHIKAILELPR